MRGCYKTFASPFLAVISLVPGIALAQFCPADVLRTAPDNRYEVLNGGAEVLDSQTGLVWQRCSLGLNWDGAGCGGAVTAFSWQQALQQAKSAAGGWVLPDKRQLQSLVERGCNKPAINDRVFPDTQTGWYWTSSSVAGHQDYAWVTDFYYGQAYDGLKTAAYHVRLVRPYR
jgi:hypothetical protein